MRENELRRKYGIFVFNTSSGKSYNFEYFIQFNKIALPRRLAQYTLFTPITQIFDLVLYSPKARNLYVHECIVFYDGEKIKLSSVNSVFSLA